MNFAENFNEVSKVDRRLSVLVLARAIHNAKETVVIQEARDVVVRAEHEVVEEQPPSSARSAGAVLLHCLVLELALLDHLVLFRLQIFDCLALQSRQLAVLAANAVDQLDAVEELHHQNMSGAQVKVRLGDGNSVSPLRHDGCVNSIQILCLLSIVELWRWAQQTRSLQRGQYDSDRVITGAKLFLYLGKGRHVLRHGKLAKGLQGANIGSKFRLHSWTQYFYSHSFARRLQHGLVNLP